MSQTIQTLLQTASTSLMPASETPRLDAELLLTHVLKKTRTYLHTWIEEKIIASDVENFFSLIRERQQGKPLAYLTGHKAFWSLDFSVTEATLIPRPETELLVELILHHVVGEKKQLADLGTGCGAIALSLAFEKPDWQIYATDKSRAALSVAQLNAERFALNNVIFREGDWCQALPKMLFDVVVSNPPYLASSDEHLRALSYEPHSALVAKDGGLADIQCIIAGAKAFLKSNGHLMIEHGCTQGEVVRRLFAGHQYEQVETIQDLAGLERVTVGRAMV